MLGAVIIAVIGVVVYCRHEGRRRWATLRERRLVVSPSSVESISFQRIVAIDLGYGEEIWLLRSTNLEVDRHTRIPRDAVVLQKNALLPQNLENTKERISVRF